PCAHLVSTLPYSATSPGGAIRGAPWRPAVGLTPSFRGFNCKDRGLECKGKRLTDPHCVPMPRVAVKWKTSSPDRLPTLSGSDVHRVDHDFLRRSNGREEVQQNVQARCRQTH